MKAMMHRPDLSIVIPSYQEEKRIGGTLISLSQFINDDKFCQDKQIEVIVVAADTKDKTKDIVLANQHLFNNLTLLEPGPQVGKGRDVREGMLHARGEFILFMDADLATPLDQIKRLYEVCVSSADIAIGVRDHSIRHPSQIRRVVSNIGNSLFILASGLYVIDTQCGFKMFRRNAANLCFTKLTLLEWWFDMEILVIARTNKLKITPITLSRWSVRPYSTYKVSSIEIVVTYIRDLSLIFKNRILGNYK
jgi:dolichyl-phosphate beta-glucosyltransferase